MKINAELVSKARKKKCWSQEELAIAAGLNLRTIQRIEKEASASLQSKKALASALQIDIQDLDYEEIRTQTCPECNSKEIYQYKGEIDSDDLGRTAAKACARSVLLCKSETGRMRELRHSQVVRVQRCR